LIHEAGIPRNAAAISFCCFLSGAAGLLQTGKIEAAWAICERARQSGYNEPLIETACQKVAAARNQPGNRDLPRE